MDLGPKLSHSQKSLNEIFRIMNLELIMSKKQAKPKKGFKLSSLKQAKLTESSLRKYSDIIDQTIKLTNVEVGDQKNAKDRLKKSMITRVKKDYLSLTQHTYLLSIEGKSHEDWFKNQANYIFWLELFTYLQSHKIKCEYRINFYKELFDYLIKLDDENLFYLINKEILKRDKYHIPKIIYKTDFINYFKLPRNIFEKSKVDVMEC